MGVMRLSGLDSGVHRRYANKSVLNTTAAGADISHSYTAHGDPSTSVSAWINLPLIEDKLAVRGVFYDDMRGGYIRNVPGTFSQKPTDQGIAGHFGGVVPPLSGSLANTNLVQDAFNPITYEGPDVGALSDQRRLVCP
jgi:iron complex outermembrane receptor protein